MMMTEQRDSGLIRPNILIVGVDASFRGRLGLVFTNLGADHESVRTASDAIERLQDNVPPVTAVLTEALQGDYRRVVEAAMDIGANAVLLATSSLTVSDAKQEGIPAFLKGRIHGKTPEKRDMLAALKVKAPTWAIAG